MYSTLLVEKMNSTFIGGLITSSEFVGLEAIFLLSLEGIHILLIVLLQISHTVWVLVDYITYNEV